MWILLYLYTVVVVHTQIHDAHMLSGHLAMVAHVDVHQSNEHAMDMLYMCNLSGLEVSICMHTCL